MPLFILYGGEIVFLIVGLRIAVWLLRGGIYRERGPGGGPPRSGGRPAPVIALGDPRAETHAGSIATAPVRDAA